MKCFERIDENNKNVTRLNENSSFIYTIFISVLCLCMCLHEVTSACLFYKFFSTQTTLSQSNKSFHAIETPIFASESIVMNISCKKHAQIPDIR